MKAIVKKIDGVLKVVEFIDSSLPKYDGERGEYKYSKDVDNVKSYTPSPDHIKYFEGRDGQIVEIDVTYGYHVKAKSGTVVENKTICFKDIPSKNYLEEEIALWLHSEYMDKNYSLSDECEYDDTPTLYAVPVVDLWENILDEYPKHLDKMTTNDAFAVIHFVQWAKSNGYTLTKISNPIIT